MAVARPHLAAAGLDVMVARDVEDGPIAQHRPLLRARAATRQHPTLAAPPPHLSANLHGCCLLRKQAQRALVLLHGLPEAAAAAHLPGGQKGRR